MLRPSAPVCLLAGLLVLRSDASGAETPTAFKLIQEGNRYVGEHCKDHVVEIRSDKSIGSLTPTIWHVVFYDPTTTLKATEVKFGAGRMMDVGRPMRLLEPMTGKTEPLDRKRMNIDSDRALEIARTEPLLDKLKLTASRLKLERGVAGLPVWRVRLWAAKLRRPDREAELGEVVISADDGKVLERDLKISRVD